MEGLLGMVNGRPSRGKAIVLRNNGIRSRHYALDRNGNITHSNAELVTEALNALQGDGFNLNDVQVLACGTSAPDQNLPSHAAMVHGLLPHTADVVSPSGACCSGMHALKYGYMSILSGQSTNAVATGSELVSPMMLARNFEAESERASELEHNPIIGFEKDFLRWMLSDGAGAALMEAHPRAGQVNLRIEWVETRSYANEFAACMYSSADKDPDGTFRSWKSFTTDEWLSRSVFAMKQDVKLLGRNIVPIGGRYLQEICGRRRLDIATVDWFLPHLSSNFFKDQVYNELKSRDMEIPYEKWFTNLTEVGNVGSASIFIMLDSLVRSGRLHKGQQVLLMVPESARFLYAYALLTVC